MELNTIDLFDYLGIDEPDDINQINALNALETAKEYVKGVVGSDIETVLPDAPQYKTAVKMYAKAIYEQRDDIEQARGFEALIWQLQRKYNKAKKAAGTNV
ncbi:MAG: head-tail connector protein [Acutalibacteraceae bacterium]